MMEFEIPTYGEQHLVVHVETIQRVAVSRWTTNLERGVNLPGAEQFLTFYSQRNH
jgi:hypothetical protein